MAVKFTPKKKKITGTKSKDKITWVKQKGWTNALTVNAGKGNDIINFKKSKYKNKLNGQDGHDKIYGGKNADTIYGGKGNDKLYGYAGNDVIKAGAGNDYVDGGAGNDKIYGQSGTNNLKGGAGNDTIYAGTGVDNIWGGAGDDVIDLGKGGKNTVYAEAGKDRIINIKGNSVVDGGADNDTIIAISGNNTLNGGAGNDIIYAGTGNDKIYAGSGNDKIDLSKGGNNTVYLESGNNEITKGGAGNDTIFSGKGADTINAGTGNNKIYHNTGNENDTILAGGGVDTLIFNGISSIDDLGVSFSDNNVVITRSNGEKVTLKDALINGHSVKYIQSGSTINSMSNYKYLIDSSEESINGTVWHDDIYLRNNGATVYAGDGDDIVHISEMGSYNLYLGHGNKTLVTPENFNRVVHITMSEDLAFDFYRVNDNLVIKYTTTGWENDSLTIKGYYSDNRDVSVYYDDKHQYMDHFIALNGGVKISGEGLIEGTPDTDVIYGSDKADIIYVNKSDSVYAGKGDDTLIWKEDEIRDGIPSAMGQQKIYIKNGDGNDTLIFEAKPFSMWQLHFDEDTILKYERKNNDLLIHRTFDVGGKPKTETVTIKDWQTSNLSSGRILVYQTQEIPEGNSAYSSLQRGDARGGIVENAGYATSLNINLYGSDDKDFLGVSGTNIKAYGYAGDDLYSLRGQNVYTEDTKGDEEYRAYTLNNKQTIKDLMGNDSLTLYDEKSTGEVNLNDASDNRQLHLMFNVNKNYKASQGVATVGDIILTADASKENYDLWQADGAFKGISIKNNAIETINSSDNYSLTNTDIAALAQTVASWLSNNTSFASVNDLFENGTSEQITALIAQFDTANWQSV